MTFKIDPNYEFYRTVARIDDKPVKVYVCTKKKCDEKVKYMVIFSRDEHPYYCHSLADAENIARAYAKNRHKCIETYWLFTEPHEKPPHLRNPN